MRRGNGFASCDRGLGGALAMRSGIAQRPATLHSTMNHPGSTRTNRRQLFIRPLPQGRRIKAHARFQLHHARSRPQERSYGIPGELQSAGAILENSRSLGNKHYDEDTKPPLDIIFGALILYRLIRRFALVTESYTGSCICSRRCCVTIGKPAHSNKITSTS